MADIEFQYMCRKFKEIRLRKKLKQVDVAVGADINPNYYGQIERGLTKNMHLSTFYGIRQALNAKWKEILHPNNYGMILILPSDDETNDKS